MSLLVGMDIGGTKAAVRVETLARELVAEVVVPSPDWDAEPVADGVDWIARTLESVLQSLPGGVLGDASSSAGARTASVAALGVGAQGLDNAAIMLEYGAALTARLGIPTVAVNDAALIAPAAGLDQVIGLIAGTGAIGVGWSADGEFLAAGGWGSVIGDDAGAAGIVREATKRALLRHDDGFDDDGLLAALLETFGVTDAERLARAVNDDPSTENWGPHAPVVFEAAHAGSLEAQIVIEGAAQHLARLVRQLVAHGAVGSDVVAAGSVISAQPLLFDRMSDLVTAAHHRLHVRLLDRPPVAGATELAARLVGAPASAPTPAPGQSTDSLALAGALADAEPSPTPGQSTDSPAVASAPADAEPSPAPGQAADSSSESAPTAAPPLTA
ncbi:N-acetylglucosamine kinase [Herbiconiux sp. UC225_62]|uniref:N-acetylglucosamine kinase n=1 Tax=Herbiconiux sp. UC225_62 TaxID=3350168 RepID=UPI0036D31E3A